jgi:hypothetical protein
MMLRTRASALRSGVSEWSASFTGWSCEGRPRALGMSRGAGDQTHDGARTLAT